ncbi:hypothetical protein FRC11_011610 [Ceratobasidium sp. 423]|nr:hypothetical protein FRC11_011610 [Ceratobasidium sp. 423]
MDYLPPLTRLLTSSPGLISLTLSNPSLDPVSAVNIVSSLGSAWVFPRLRTFRIHWASEEYPPEVDNSDWNHFFTLPGRDSHPLRSFFLRHQGIEDLALGWCPDKSYEGDIEPDDIVQLFPSLKRFEGPAFLCNAIIKSDIAQNLEALAMVDMTFLDQTDWLGAMGDGMRNMPRLRSLDIRAHGFREILDPLILDDFILAAPGIETLECRLEVTDFVAILIAISHTRKLRKLVVDGQSWVASALNQRREENPAYEDWEDVISRIAKRCRLLETFESVDGWEGSRVWEVIRDEEGDYLDAINVG